jgi:hypothetical protein
MSANLICRFDEICVGYQRVGLRSRFINFIVRSNVIVLGFCFCVYVVEGGVGAFEVFLMIFLVSLFHHDQCLYQKTDNNSSSAGSAGLGFAVAGTDITIG